MLFRSRRDHAQTNVYPVVVVVGLPERTRLNVERARFLPNGSPACRCHLYSATTAQTKCCDSHLSRGITSDGYSSNAITTGYIPFQFDKDLVNHYVSNAFEENKEAKKCVFMLEIEMQISDSN